MRSIFTEDGLLEASRDKLGIALEAYSPLGTGRHLTDGTVPRQSPDAQAALRPRC